MVYNIYGCQTLPCKTKNIALVKRGINSVASTTTSSTYLLTTSVTVEVCFNFLKVYLYPHVFSWVEVEPTKRYAV